MQTKLSKLEAKIRELCPELMELSFGCKFKFKNEYGQLLWIKKSKNTPNAFTFLLDGEYMYFEKDEQKMADGYTYSLSWFGSNNYERHSYNLFEDFKIIGHPIRLEHVLRAIAIGREGDQLRLCLHNGEVLIFKFDRKGFALWALGKPWEFQTEVHELLFRILNIQ